jgi:signal transduction histidine kinase
VEWRQVVGKNPTREQVETNERESKHPGPSTLAALNVLCDLVGQSTDLKEMLGSSLDEVMAAVGADLAQVLILNGGSDDLIALAGRGGMAGLDDDRQIDLGRALARVILDGDQALIVEDVSAHPRLKELAALRSGLRSYAGIPLTSRGKTIGALNLINFRPRQLRDEEARDLARWGRMVATVIDNDRLHTDLANSRHRLRERVKEIGALYDVTGQALAAPDIGAFLLFVARRLPASMQHERASVVITCSVGERSYLAWSDDLQRAQAEKLRVLPGAGATGERVAGGKAAVEYGLGRAGLLETGLDVRSRIAVPIAIDDDVVGYLCVCYLNRGWRFLTEEKQLLYGISEQIAQFIGRHEMERESRQRTQQLSSLFEVSKALAAVVDLENLLPVIEDTLRETLRPAEAGALLLFDEGTGMLRVESAFGYDSGPLRKINLQVGESISGMVFESGVPGVWPTPEEAARGMANMSEHNRDLFRQASGGMDCPHSAIGVPLVYREGKIGVVTLETLRGKNGLSVSDLPFLQALAELIVINVDKIWLLEQTEQTKAIEEANRLKSELIAALAHDMRTPLASIKGYASAMLLDDVEWDDEVGAEHLRIINEEANELQTMIQDLLESSIIDAGLLQIEKEPVLLPRLVEQIVGEMTRRTAKHRFVTSFAKDFPIVDADPRRIRQVLRNLLDNAVRYSPDGGLVVVRGQARGGEVIVSVADEGIGLAPEHLNRLFEKFFRLKSPLGQQVRGSGLGLPISRTIVESHGGRIWAESELGKGTTIYFSLPRDGIAAPAEQA